MRPFRVLKGGGVAAPKIAVVDYHKGNLSSVARGLSRAGAQAFISDNPEEIAAAQAAVVPGVGAFYDAATFMQQHGQAEAVRAMVDAGKPVLGICLGLQLLFDCGDEGVPEDVPASDGAKPNGAGLACGTPFRQEGKRWARGLGLAPGRCTRLRSSRLKVPHVGWDQLHLTQAGRTSALLRGVPEGANMYFTHSYAVEDAAACDVLARTHYANSFACAVQHGSAFGVQFHPEKSSAAGQLILGNFVRIAEGDLK